MTAVSIVSTIRDEPPARVQRMLAALAAQEGAGPLEVVISAPRSEHPGLAVIEPSGAIESITLVDNPSGDRSPGLNAAVRAARHPVCCRVDARSIVPPTYVAESAAMLLEGDDIGIVGGAQAPISIDRGAVARGIARGLANPYALGGAAYRRVGQAGPADTAYLGTFEKEAFLALGGYDERLDANEDFDLCARYRRAGYVVYVLGTPVAYEARGTFGEVARQYEAFGRAKARYWRTTGERPNARQLLALSAALVATVSTAALLAWSPGRVLYLAAGGVGGLALVDHLGAGRGSIPERAVSCATYAVVYGAWLKGIAAGWSSGR